MHYAAARRLDMDPKPEFLDYFSSQASVYAKYRPTYPPELYQWLADMAPGHDAAWDCATGNGQVAVALAEYFKDVQATDASAAQIANQKPHKRVSYSIALAEDSGFPEESFDLVTVGNAVHWFDRPRFFAEANRVLKPEGIISLWRYGFFYTGDQAIDAQIYKLGEVILKDYWSPLLTPIRDGYYDQPFPFKDEPAPEIDLKVNWSFAELCGYFDTWSATQAYITQRNSHPRELLHDKLLAAWGDPEEKRELSSPLQVRIGRKA